MSAIPGLNSPNDYETDEPGNDFTLTSFDLHTFTLTEAQRYGDCRLISEFEKISQIGEGAFGLIYKVKDLKSNEIVVLKKLKNPKHAGLPMHFLREVAILQSLQHANIVALFDLAVGRCIESLYLVFEYCPYELHKVLDDNDAVSLLDQSQVKCIMQQLFTGLKYIHKHYIVHRDLTVSNILFNDNGVLKIADFGSSRTLSEKEMTPNVVSRWYRSPELLFGSELYTFAIDVWSAACILAELILKRPLFKAKSDSDMIAALVELLSTPTEQSWPGMSALPLMQIFDLCQQPHNRLKSTFKGQPDTCIALLENLLVYDAKSRFSAQQCLSHAYFTDEPIGCDLNTLLTTLKKPQEM